MKKLLFYTLLLIFCPSTYGQNNNSEVTTNHTERIINFHTDIIIDTTGVIRVSECIKVYACGNEIKRGIVRSIPVYRTNKYGKKKKMNIDIVSVLCNGHTERYKIENTFEYKEIYIGNPDGFLVSGIYEYVIVYETPGQIGFFDTYDELYWNVTGNDWAFYIEQASATITLPQDVHSINTSCYTGYFGSPEMNCSAEESGNTVFFETGNLLGFHEGFTVAVSFPRDIIKRPPPPTKFERFWETYKYLLCALTALFIFAVFFYFTWRKVGKDPEKPIVIPTFHPPYDRSPAATRYLYKKKYDDKVFAAALVSMAVKGAILISNEDKQYALEPIERKGNLSVEEKLIYDMLFTANHGIKVSNENHLKFASANIRVTKSLDAAWKLKHYFRHNPKYAAWGAALTTALISLYFIITLSTNSEIASFKEGWVTGIFLSVIFVLYGLYVYLIKAPTKLGAQTTSELEGFRMYLKTAEEQQLNALTPPEKTPELFEKLLPYAIALGVENKWSEKFAAVLQQFNYNPDWYVSNQPFMPSLLASTFAPAFTSSVGSAGINPATSSGGGWSSGSGGGGFSGGGGGGGGGGGW
jgi:uncharacterized membrane protein YgcG